MMYFNAFYEGVSHKQDNVTELNFNGILLDDLIVVYIDFSALFLDHDS